ncbi:CPBP family intramembrane glutamic endopeptidase [Kribbella sp. HUAS MG21]|uniref:CPBP family intramembrane glutamic endopeptidase n=1 Tax=Kribbella sp. HUAS MG21 TaxID=3160966 RepID=A0AAU7TLV4_9ACTN
MTSEQRARSGFWERSTAWKAVLLIIGCLVFYLAVGWVVGRVFDGEIDDGNPIGTASSTFFALVLPVAIGGAVLLLVTARLGWLRTIFGPQPVGGSRWMWVAPVLVVVAIVGHLGATSWSSWSSVEVLMVGLLGICIGVAEELATRGLAVKILRDAGHSERYVMVVSSLLFALMHTINLLSGMTLGTVAATLVYTFGFGACIYLAMRVTGTIWTAIVLHALTDPSTFLATGGIDEAVTDQTGGMSLLAAAATILLILVGVVAIFLVHGKAQASGDV